MFEFRHRMPTLLFAADGAASARPRAVRSWPTARGSGELAVPDAAAAIWTDDDPTPLERPAAPRLTLAGAEEALAAMGVTAVDRHELARRLAAGEDLEEIARELELDDAMWQRHRVRESHAQPVGRDVARGSEDPVDSERDDGGGMTEE